MPIKLLEGAHARLIQHWGYRAILQLHDGTYVMGDWMPTDVHDPNAGAWKVSQVGPRGGHEQYRYDQLIEQQNRERAGRR